MNWQLPLISGIPSPSKWSARTRIFSGAAVLIALLAGYFLLHARSAPVKYRTAAVTRGNLTAVISASGTVEPEEVIDVGAQVAGRIVRFGTDQSGKAIDYGSHVQAGTILAVIDDTAYRSDLDQAAAALEQAKSGVLRAEADLEQAKAKMVQAERDWNRAKQLGPSDALSQSDFDAAEANYETAKASVNVSRASILQAKNSVVSAEAALQKAKQTLSYCTIRSPISGVIIDRRVNIGQTVVASLNAPSLFLIAKDLRRMQVWVPVNEADIGSIHPGQSVQFNVDAFAGTDFQGRVEKIRLNAAMTQNIVTYTVVVSTNNSDGKLLPYLTANVRFVVSERKNVLMVPNAALRWSPRAQSDAKPSASADAKATEAKKNQNDTAVYTLREGKPHMMRVQAGQTDGSMTEVTGEGISEQLVVITGTESQTETPQQTSNPFAPNMGRGRPDQKKPQ